jgi:SAM-dependent methyltransferase
MASLGTSIRGYMDSIHAQRSMEGSSMSLAEVDAWLPEAAEVLTLSELRGGMDDYRRAMSNDAYVDSIRQFNWYMIGELNKIVPLRDIVVLDVGASPHGYALERALELGANTYLGIGLDIAAPLRVAGANGAVGILAPMDVLSMTFPDDTFDAIISMSTFEHILDPRRALDEMARVLKPGGFVLATADGIWSCPYGHHLLHYGSCAELVPPWAHLYWSQGQMADYLEPRWPADAPISVAEATAFVYESGDINRLNVRQLRDAFAACGLSKVWSVEHRAEDLDGAALSLAADETKLDADDLSVRAMTVCLKKPKKTRALSRFALSLRLALKSL